VGDDQNRKIAEEFAAAFESGDQDRMWRVFDQYIGDDFVQTWPQSGERIRGKDNARAINQNYPGGMPSAKAKGIRGGGNTWVFEAELDYGQGPVHMVSIAEMENGKIVRQTDYFAQPFEALEWRSKWVERI
jgi:SnoaL-like protein